MSLEEHSGVESSSKKRKIASQTEAPEEEETTPGKGGLPLLLVPKDVIAHWLLPQLPIADFLSMRETCRALRELSDRETVWVALFAKTYGFLPAKNVPPREAFIQEYCLLLVLMKCEVSPATDIQLDRPTATKVGTKAIETDNWRGFIALVNEIRQSLNRGTLQVWSRDATKRIRSCSAEIFRVLAKCGANLRVVSSYWLQESYDPLQLAIRWARTDIIAVLLKEASVTLTSKDRLEAVVAAHAYKEEVFDYLVEHDPHSWDDHNYIAAAVEEDNLAIAAKLLKLGAPVKDDGRLANHKQLWMEVAEWKDAACVKFMIDAGVDLDEPGDYEEVVNGSLVVSETGQTILGHLVNRAVRGRERHSRIVEIAPIAAFGHPLTVYQDSAIDTVDYLPPSLVRAALKAGAKPNRLHKGKYPLGMAVCGRNVEVARALIESGADVNLGRHSPLLQAIYKSSFELCQLLINAGAKVNATDINGLSLLGVAKAGGQEKIAALLARAGAREFGGDE